MEITKRIFCVRFFVLFLLLVGDHHRATEFVTVSTATAETSETYSNRWIQEQISGTLNVCSDILEVAWKNDTNKTLHPNVSHPFNVCVPKKAAFPEFIDVRQDGKLKGGFSIAIFCLALQELPFKSQPVFKLIRNESYTQVVQKLESKDCDVVAGDITITLNRTQYADFTIAYMSSKIYMLVPAKRNWKQSMLTLLRPFTMRLWIAIIVACILIGTSIGYLEYREKNPSFYDVPFYQKLFMIIWFPVSKIFFQEGEIRNKCSKLVLVTWLTAIFVVMQIFTACLSSWLTVNQLQPKLPKQYKEIGYQSGSYILDLVEGTALELSSVDEYKNALDSGRVDAICDEDPYIDIFLAKYGDNYVKVGPTADEPGLGFKCVRRNMFWKYVGKVLHKMFHKMDFSTNSFYLAFSHGSPLQQSFSNAIIKVTESPYMAQMKNKYLGTQTPPTTDHPIPQSLDVHSFFLLFLSMGLATSMAIIISEVSLMRTCSKKSNESREVVTTVGL